MRDNQTDMMKNYVISLPSAGDRRRHIVEQFGREQVTFEFFDAITPDQAQVIFRQWFPHAGIEMLSAGELACLVSHLSVWQQAKAQGLVVTGPLKSVRPKPDAGSDERPRSG